MQVATLLAQQPAQLGGQGQPRVPQPAHDPQAVVDDLDVDLGLAELGGAGQELGDQQVLAFGSQLDIAERCRARQTGVAA
jgi:hypothetical protein